MTPRPATKNATDRNLGHVKLRGNLFLEKSAFVCTTNVKNVIASKCGTVMSFAAQAALWIFTTCVSVTEGAALFAYTVGNVLGISSSAQVSVFAARWIVATVQCLGWPFSGSKEKRYAVCKQGTSACFEFPIAAACTSAQPQTTATFIWRSDVTSESFDIFRAEHGWVSV